MSRLLLRHKKELFLVYQTKLRLRSFGPAIIHFDIIQHHSQKYSHLLPNIFVQVNIELVQRWPTPMVKRVTIGRLQTT